MADLPAFNGHMTTFISTGSVLRASACDGAMIRGRIASGGDRLNRYLVNKQAEHDEFPFQKIESVTGLSYHPVSESKLLRFKNLCDTKDDADTLMETVFDRYSSPGHGLLPALERVSDTPQFLVAPWAPISIADLSRKSCNFWVACAVVLLRLFTQRWSILTCLRRASSRRSLLTRLV